MSGRGSRGGRGSMSVPPDTRITGAILRVPNQKTLSELRRLSYAFPAMGEFPNVAHMDATLGFTEYAYAVGAVQPDVPRTIQEARASPDAAKWNAAAEREMKSLNDRKVYKLVPRSAVPPGRKRIKPKWAERGRRSCRRYVRNTLRNNLVVRFTEILTYLSVPPFHIIIVSHIRFYAYVFYRADVGL